MTHHHYYAAPENDLKRIGCKVIEGAAGRAGYLDLWIGNQRVGTVRPDGALYLWIIEKRHGLQLFNGRLAVRDA